MTGRSFGNVSPGNRIVVIIVVGIAGVIMERPNGVGSDSLFQLLYVQFHVFVHRFLLVTFTPIVLCRPERRRWATDSDSPARPRQHQVSLEPGAGASQGPACFTRQPRARGAGRSD